MAGTLPKTSLIVVQGDRVLGYYETYYSAAISLDISINDKGVIMWQGEEVLPNYILDTEDSGNGFTKQGAITDWFKRYFHKYSTVKVLRYLV